MLRSLRGFVACGLLVVGVFFGVCGVSLAASPGWVLRAAAEPSGFAAADSGPCNSEEKCDRYQLVLLNVGGAASSGTLTLTDRLPAGVVTSGTPLSGTIGSDEETRSVWQCSEGAGQSTVSCRLELKEFGEEVSARGPGLVPAGSYAPTLTVLVSPPVAGPRAVGENVVTVQGGGAGRAAQSSLATVLNGVRAPFSVSQFAFETGGEDGASSLVAGAHPWELTTSFGLPTVASPAGGGSGAGAFLPVGNTKSALVELPAGFVGNPLATKAKCLDRQLRQAPVGCPKGSEVGLFAVTAGLLGKGQFADTEVGELGASEARNCTGEQCTPIFNMVPSKGYPAELGLSYAQVPILMYASLVRGHPSVPGGPVGYRLRVDAPGIPGQVGLTNAALTFFGEPGGPVNGTGGGFLTNPGQCPSGGLNARIELESWGDQGHPVSRETNAYPSLSGCSLLPFNPAFSFEPTPAAEGAGGSSQADAPSAFTADLRVPQTSGFGESATASIRNATVTLPAGVSLNPAGGAGIVGCDAEGPSGINIGSENIGAGDRDLGDPEATELGRGDASPGGNASQYDDGVYHIAKGHCPDASKVGTAEVFTPLLPSRCGAEGQAACLPGESPAPLQGHLFIATPKCGGAGQPACTEASATNGELFGGYLEVEGDGVIVKLKGSFAADPRTGQITASFRENPDVPFSELKLHVNGGPRAPLANPQSCGTASTTADLEPWSAPAGGDALVSSSFTVTGCSASTPFAPSFTAETTSSSAGAFSPFVMSFSRQDREGDLSGLSVTLPPGLLAKIAGVPECPEAQANAGTCGAESQVGSVSATAGAGSSPLAITGGRVYLTTGYGGQPFGLSVVVPADAGPFNLGDVVVRAAIHIDPNTAQVTVVSDPLPQIKDGVPFRLRSVNVQIDRPGFTLNPTSCAQQHVTGTISAAQGAAANVSSPFAATGCRTLPFKPSFSAATRGPTSKANGASLTVRVAQRPGEANIRRVDLRLPKILPSRNETLNKACTEAQFAASPAGCPAASFIGTAVAHTPILAVPLEGPAILVSHGGAAFPDVEFVLQGGGVTVVLDGKTFIDKAGYTYSHFETVPDAPISSFESIFPQGRHSIFAAYIPSSPDRSFCDSKIMTVKQRVTVREHGHSRRVTRTVKKRVPETLTIPTTITGQNGAVITQTTRVAVTGCTRAKAAKRAGKATRKR
jgi:hypothetical protein